MLVANSSFVAQVRKMNVQARHKLTSCRIVTEDYDQDDLPGRPWKVGPTMDVSMTQKTNFARVFVVHMFAK